MKSKAMAMLLFMLSIPGVVGVCHGQQALCILSASPSVLYFEAEGGSAEVTITPSAPDCSYTPRTSYSWITVSSVAMTGKSTLTIQVSAAANLAQRVGSVMIGGTQVEVVQKARNLLSW